ncbi:MAG: hypothetical protein IPK58_18645 [Acidobacteria bacterium]|nr:hypothetical protein [Acidobacteriota bacterium]
MKTRNLMMSIAAVIVAILGASPYARAQGELKATFDQINKLRAEPERAGELIDEFIADAFTDEALRNQTLNDKYDGKTSRQLVEQAVKYIESLPKMEPLKWDSDLVTIANNRGQSNNKLFKPDGVVTTPDANAKKAILWFFLRGQEWDYKNLLNPAVRFTGFSIKGDNIVIALAGLGGKAYLMNDSDFGSRPYDPREDRVEPWGDALSVKQPNIISFAKADGTLDVVWRDMGTPPRVFLTRFAANGSRIFTKEVPGVDPNQYQLLGGFTEDPDGNIYVLRVRDEGDHDKKSQPDPPRNDKGEPDPNWDRPDMVRLTKLDKNGAELWTKNLAKKGGQAFGFIAPMSPNSGAEEAGRVPGRDRHSATSRIGFYVHKGTPIIFALYGGATEWDPQIDGRHQNAYWRAVDARTGDPVQDLNGGAMAHSFDYQLLVTDEGVITAERSDSGLLMSNYLMTRRDELIFHFFYGTTTDGNECFTQLGSIQPASDGYLVLFAGNNSESLSGKSVSGAASTAEMIRNRNLLVMRIKKGFAQDLDALGDGSEDDKKTLKTALNSMVRSEFREGLNLTGRTYLTSYSKDDSYSASRPKMVRMADGNYVVIWERWTHQIKKDGKSLEGKFDSTWAMKINQDGEIIKEAVKLSDSVRITRGDEPVLWNGKATFLAGDIVENKMMIYSVDGDLKFGITPVAVQ